MVIGLALAATTSYADTKPAPLGTSVAKVTRSPVAKVKIKINAKAAPVRKVARKVAPVRSYRATKVARTAPRKIAPVRTQRAPKAVRAVAKRTARPATVRPRISPVQRKATGPTVRVARQAIASKARLAQRPKATPTKINKGPSEIIKSTAQQAGTAKRSLAAKSAKAAQTRPVEVKATGTVLRRPSVEATVTLPVVGTAEAKGNVLPVEASVSPVEVSVPLLDLPTVAMPPVELPAVTLPRTGLPPVTLPPTDPLALTPSIGRPGVTTLQPQADERASPVAGTASARAETARTPQGLLAGVGATVVSALTASTPSMQSRAMLAIGPPVVAIFDELGQRFRTAKVPDSAGPTATALVIAAAIGAAATGTVGSGSAGATGLAVLSTALRLPALGGSRRLRGRLRESAFRRPRLPGFSPD